MACMYVFSSCYPVHHTWLTVQKTVQYDSYDSYDSIDRIGPIGPIEPIGPTRQDRQIQRR